MYVILKCKIKALLSNPLEMALENISLFTVDL